MGGVSVPAKLFFEKRYGHVLRGGGGQRASSKVVFCKKVCFGVPEELLCVKIIYSRHNLDRHNPDRDTTRTGQNPDRDTTRTWTDSKFNPGTEKIISGYITMVPYIQA